jgi:hypothetical protein
LKRLQTAIQIKVSNVDGNGDKSYNLYLNNNLRQRKKDMRRPLDNEVQALAGHVHIYMKHSHKWTDDVRLHHRKVLHDNYSRLLALPQTEVSHSVWDDLIDSFDDAGIPLW